MHELGRYLQRKLDDHGWTVSELIRRTGLSRQTVYNLINDNREYMDQTPQRKTVNGLAQALGVSPTEILTVSAQALGVPIEALPPENSLSNASDQQILMELASRLSRSKGQDNESTSTDEVIPPRLRAVAPTSDPSPGQKTEPERFVDISIHDLAAHPYFETEHEKFERLHGERGEENQDPDSGNP
ncbi:helix-turn-helix domain-containing protein [Glutamicibacter arilaitensis]|uniref:helix-turn-helix domain-containing protein n=1 Tax=Glutamicibacter arilaitensis TaxID=256701 RepID=UPI003FCFA1B5